MARTTTNDSRRFTPTEDSDYLASDPESEVLSAFDEIDSPHNSPVKAKSSRTADFPPSSASKSKQRARRDQAEGAASKAANDNELPRTPTRKLERHASTEDSRRSAAIEHFMTLEIPPRGNLAPKRLFTGKGTSSRPCQIIEISDSEDDQNMAEVSMILTDTEDDTKPVFSLFGRSAVASSSSLEAQVVGSVTITAESSFNSVGSAVDIFQTNRARAINQSNASSPSKGSPTKTPNTKRISVIQEALSVDYTEKAPTPVRLGPAPAETILISRSSRQRPSAGRDKGKAPIRKPASSKPQATTSMPFPTPAPKPEPSPALQAFLKLDLGSNLEPVIVCHDAHVQRLMDNAGIAWGTQYELARGVLKNRWDWEAVAQKIGLLKGSNADVAARVGNIIKNRATTVAPDIALWEELDREEAATLDGRGLGLGCMGAWMGVKSWYGGRIQQLASLERNGKDSQGNHSYKVILEPMEKQRCHRLARYLGSRRVLQLRIPSELVQKENQQLLEFLSRKFVLCGRVFMPLSSKDSGVYLVEVNEDYERKPNDNMGDHLRQSLTDIIRWANPIEYNFAQPISKWSTRFALALSNSTPALEFDEKNIIEIDDLYGPAYKGVGKAPAELILTDGCGFMNEAALKRIQTFLGLEFRPTAVQGRIKGAKGVWTLEPNNSDPEPKIWLRKSQIKIELKTPLHRSQRIFDLLAASRPSTSVSLSAQTILNLSFNGVPSETLVKLLEKGLREEVEPLMKWDTPQAMVLLYDAVAKMGGVSRARAVRVAGALSRALGLERRDWGNDDVVMKNPKEQTPDTDDLEDSVGSGYTGRNPFSLAPLSLHEAALELIQAGFHPQDCPELKKKLEYIMHLHVNSIIEKYNIPLVLSVNNYVIPDPCGVLGAGEVYYRSSSSLIDPETHTAFNVFTGPVLIGRYPVRLPSDVQKFVAVDHPMLSHYPDVLIVSTKGEVSVASVLSGGDYDGDECFVLAEPSVVLPFNPKPLFEQPTEVQQDFKKDVTFLETFVAELDGQTPDKAFSKQLLLGLHDSKKGLYSTFHDMAVWKHGYDDARAIRLAYMFNTLLDSGKTGLRLKDHVFSRDQKAFGGKVPSLSDLPKSTKKKSILHILAEAGKHVATLLETQFNAVPSAGREYRDQDLLKPYMDAKALASKSSTESSLLAEEAQARKASTKSGLLAEELQLIEGHVDEIRQQWVEALGKIKSSETQTKKQRLRKSKPDPMLIIARNYAEDIQGVELFRDARLIKASYAYMRTPNFALNNAFGDLCTIKARCSPGGLAPIARSFDEAKGITSAYIRALASMTSEE